MEGEKFGCGERRQRGGKTCRWKMEEMREICEREARDEEERVPDEGDSHRHRSKDR